MTDNLLYYGDNLTILKEYIPDNSVDLIYLDPPFNSKSSYNILFKEHTGKQSKAQITAFEDTWHWTEETERTFQDICDTAPADVVIMMGSFRDFISENDMMAYLTMMCIRLVELRRVLKDTGSIYLHCDPTASHYLKILMDTVFGKKNFRNEVVWCYTSGGVSKKWYAKKHDIILFYSKTDKYVFNTIYRPYSDKTLKRGLTKVKGKYFDKGLSSEGAVLQDWWEIQPLLSPTSKERLGYPTQKPETLLERIIKASSNEDDVVLDPFCGCGTTVSVAQRLNRKWIGIDITHLAINLIKKRLDESLEVKPDKDYKVIGEPEDLPGARELASQDRYQFQWWALSLIDARPYGDKKKGADTGIDGYLFFRDEPRKTKSAIIQVKSGKVSVKDIRDLGHVIDREGSEIGIFITLEEPTKAMVKEAVIKGYYKSSFNDKDYSKLQILTIKELFAGKKPLLPSTIPSFKQAQKADLSENGHFDF